MKIKNCPFCGSKAKLKVSISTSQGGGKVAWVECSDCRCRTCAVDEWENDCEEEAVELWNTRYESS